MAFRTSSLLLALIGAAIVSAGCPSFLNTCGDACYTADLYCCVNGVLTQKAACPSTTGGTSGDNGGNNGNNNGNGGNNGNNNNNNGGGSADGRADLEIVNNCGVDLFIEGRMGGIGAPIPGDTVTVRKVPAGNSTQYNIPDTGAASTRFWAKYGCDANGRNCLIGDSMQYWPMPPGGCPDGGCHPPIDSLFEATWGCKPGAQCNSMNPTTWFDTSQVDGYTIPYAVSLFGATNQCDCNGNNCPGLTYLDASRLDVSKCPTNEDASWNGKFPNYNGNSMSNLDLRYIKNGQVLGCMSPCKKLTYGAPAGLGINEGTIPAIYMCCPTPDPSNCTLDRGCISSQDCRNGPIATTQYVTAVHQMAPGVYSYSYDDGVGLHACPAGTVKYQMTFCPKGSASYPISA